MSLSPRPRVHDLRRFPRVSGDEPSQLGAGTAWRSFSPRERG